MSTMIFIYIYIFAYIHIVHENGYILDSMNSIDYSIQMWPRTSHCYFVLFD